MTMIDILFSCLVSQDYHNVRRYLERTRQEVHKNWADKEKNKWATVLLNCRISCRRDVVWTVKYVARMGTCSCWLTESHKRCPPIWPTILEASNMQRLQRRAYRFSAWGSMWEIVGSTASAEFILFVRGIVKDRAYMTSHRWMTVSYTHLDVYKRQPWKTGGEEYLANDLRK